MTIGQSVRDLGEQGLLQLLHRFCPPEFMGDDAALLSVAEGYSLVVTTDTLVDGVHFSDRTTSAADVGWRSAAANLSDLAAMGASPLGITVGLGLPGNLPVAWVEQLYQGMTACLNQFHTPIVGGDVCRSPVVTVAITALGTVLPDQAIRRDLAKPGDAILITGDHGASRAGLELLLHPELGHALSERERSQLIQAHQRPQPRLDIIAYLQEARKLPAQGSFARIAGMDSSDGLADAVLQICRASHVGAWLDRDRLPVPPSLTALASATEALEGVLYGGEDFELVLCLPPNEAQVVVEQFETAAIVGVITTEPEVVLGDRSRAHSNETLSLSRGFQHFME